MPGGGASVDARQTKLPWRDLAVLRAALVA